MSKDKGDTDIIIFAIYHGGDGKHPEYVFDVVKKKDMPKRLKKLSALAYEVYFGPRTTEDMTK
jgi:hypothetical protein